MKTRIMSKIDSRLFQKVSGVPRIVGYWNEVDYMDVKKRLDKVKILLSLIPLNNRKGRITYKDLGIEYNGLENEPDIEQFEIILTRVQANVMLQQLKNILGD